MCYSNDRFPVACKALNVTEKYRYTAMLTVLLHRQDKITRFTIPSPITPPGTVFVGLLKRNHLDTLPLFCPKLFFPLKFRVYTAIAGDKSNDRPKRSKRKPAIPFPFILVVLRRSVWSSCSSVFD